MEEKSSQAGSLESIIFDGAKQILGCSSKTCNEAVRGDMSLDILAVGIELSLNGGVG